ncbi:MAG: RNA polymerase factor sigma-54 [Fibrobacteres bacterium]|nr:RNA polymerase factor sigma-54 [Fibrobacterota bacterium]
MSGFSLDASLRLGQTLSPQMIQSLKLLQYSNLQLEQVLRKELQENPILEESLESDEREEERTVDQSTDSGSDDSSDAAEDFQLPVSGVSADKTVVSASDDEPTAAVDGEKMKDVDWEDYEYDSFTPPVGRGSEEGEEKVDLYERINLSSESLEEHLLSQLREKRLTPKRFEIAECIIGNINETGYIAISTTELAEKFKVTESEIEEVRHIILHLDPLGIAAKDLRECLLVQVHAKGLSGSLMAKIIDKHYELLKKYQLPEIARQTGATVAEVQTAIKEIGKLEPHPGTVVSEVRSVSIIPDLIVNKLNNGEFQITLNDGYVPNLRVSKEYIGMLRKETKKSSEVRKYVSEKLNAANWLVRAIEQRKVTMIRVMTSIVNKQKDWFEKGPPNLKPLRLQEVADDISMHISTVCRVSNDKYVQTPYGVYELKQFFSSGVEQEDGTEVSTQRARDLLKELVDGEEKKKPLSDQQLVDLMKDKGIEVARRTVSKYREQLGILPARLRKEF